jgi:hypothetical protein
MLLLGPATIPYGSLPAGSLYSVIAPLVVILPILFVLEFVNQRLLSGPGAMPRGLLPLGRPYSVTVPLVVIFPILFVQ